MPGISKSWHAACPCVGHFDLDFLVIKFAVAQFLAETVAGGRARRLSDQRLKHSFLSVQVRARLDILPHLLAHQTDRNLHKVTDNLLDIAADIAHLGELCRFHLDKGSASEFREAARNLGLADTCRADHQDVFRHHLFAHLAFKLLTPPAIAQGNCHCALGVLLTDDVAVEFGNDFAGRERGHG